MKPKISLLLFLLVVLSMLSRPAMAQEEAKSRPERRKLLHDIHRERRVLHHDRMDHHDRSDRHRDRMQRKLQKERREHHRSRRER